MDMEQIVRLHADMVYRLALVHTRRKEDAEDVFQDVFLQLTKHIDKIKSDEHLRFWLVRVTVNRCHSLFGSGWNKHVTPVDTLPEDASFNDGGPDDLVFEAVCALPEKYRSILHLYYYEQMYIREIADIRQCSEGTVKSQLNRGRSLLKEKLKEARYHVE